VRHGRVEVERRVCVRREVLHREVVDGRGGRLFVLMHQVDGLLGRRRRVVVVLQLAHHPHAPVVGHEVGRRLAAVPAGEDSILKKMFRIPPSKFNFTKKLSLFEVLLQSKVFKCRIVI
jgi:hypothetical protein